MTIQNVFREAQALSSEERRELIKMLVDTLGCSETLTEAKPLPENRSLIELAGLGAEIWQGIDAQQYVDQLRREWHHCP